MIASGRRNADRFHGELFTVYIRDDRLSEKDEAIFQARLLEARQVGAQTAALDGYDPVETLMDYARTHRITQIFVGHPSRVALVGPLSGRPPGPADSRRRRDRRARISALKAGVRDSGLEIWDQFSGVRAATRLLPYP